jgi:hypothetical protein
MDKRTRGKRGVPDIIACVDGRFLAIELKAAGNTLEREQEIECNRIRDAGGVVCVAYSLREVMEGLWKAKKPNSPRKTGLAVANPPAPIELILTQVTHDELRTRRRRRQTL